jgi:hypothetical protein
MVCQKYARHVFSESDIIKRFSNTNDRPRIVTAPTNRWTIVDLLSALGFMKWCRIYEMSLTLSMRDHDSFDLIVREEISREQISPALASAIAWRQLRSCRQHLNVIPSPRKPN